MADNDAPGRLKLVQDFVNTFDVEGGVEEFATTGELSAWMLQRGLLDPSTAVGPGDLSRAKALREALRDLMAANHDGIPADRDALNILNATAERAPLRLRFSEEGAESEPLGAGLDEALGAILAITAAAMAEGTWVRLKACQRESCRWAFYDHARNRSGKWCSMAVCGNRTKAQTYRSKQASGPAESP